MKYGELTFGQVEALVNKLGGMNNVKGILSGAVELVTKVVRHIVDCSINPLTPFGWGVKEQKARGKYEITRRDDDLYLDNQKIELFLSQDQKSNNVHEGNKLRIELASMRPLPANVLDHLIEHPELIPDGWKGKSIFFWGTIYHNTPGYLYVRGLYWQDDKWQCASLSLNSGWDSFRPAAVLASESADSPGV